MRWEKIVSMGLVIIAVSAVLVTLPLANTGRISQRTLNTSKSIGRKCFKRFME